MEKKKKFIIISTIIILLLISVSCIKLINFGVKQYKPENFKFSFNIPKLSFCIKHTKNHLEFKSFRSKISLEKEINSIINEYEKYICNNSTVYYDKNNYLTIKKYYVENSGLLNSVYIEYAVGRQTNNHCSRITDPKKLLFQMKNCPADGCYETNLFKYKNEDGKIYNLYYNHSQFILFKTGLEEYNYLTNMLKYSWLSMKDVIDFMEFEVSNKNATKLIDSDKKYVMYSNKHFLLVKCTTDNKDIYIEDVSQSNKNNYCIK